MCLAVAKAVTTVRSLQGKGAAIPKQHNRVVFAIPAMVGCPPLSTTLVSAPVAPPVTTVLLRPENRARISPLPATAQAATPLAVGLRQHSVMQASPPVALPVTMAPTQQARAQITL